MQYICHHFYLVSRFECKNRRRQQAIVSKSSVFQSADPDNFYELLLARQSLLLQQLIVFSRCFTHWVIAKPWVSLLSENMLQPRPLAKLPPLAIRFHRSERPTDRRENRRAPTASRSLQRRRNRQRTNGRTDDRLQSFGRRVGWADKATLPTLLRSTAGSGEYFTGLCKRLHLCTGRHGQQPYITVLWTSVLFWFRS